LWDVHIPHPVDHKVGKWYVLLPLHYLEQYSY
jgi:hypothetical protein